MTHRSFDYLMSGFSPPTAALYCRGVDRIVTYRTTGCPWSLYLLLKLLEPDNYEKHFGIMLH